MATNVACLFSFRSAKVANEVTPKVVPWKLIFLPEELWQVEGRRLERVRPFHFDRDSLGPDDGTIQFNGQLRSLLS